MEDYLDELVKRLTDEFLEYIISLGEKTVDSKRWTDLEEMWYKSHPNKSMFISGYIPKIWQH